MMIFRIILGAMWVVDVATNNNRQKELSKTIFMKGVSLEFEVYPLLKAEHHLDLITFFSLIRGSQMAFCGNSLFDLTQKILAIWNVLS